MSLHYHQTLTQYLTPEELEEWDKIEHDLYDLRSQIDKLLIRQTQLNNRCVHRHQENYERHCKYCHTKSKGSSKCSNCGAPR